MTTIEQKKECETTSSTWPGPESNERCCGKIPPPIIIECRCGTIRYRALVSLGLRINQGKNHFESRREKSDGAYLTRFPLLSLTQAPIRQQGKHMEKCMLSELRAECEDSCHRIEMDVAWPYSMWIRVMNVDSSNKSHPRLYRPGPNPAVYDT